jgi:4-amino-4-deoxy-L-arabinose transferase-like glycosyltransferase
MRRRHVILVLLMLVALGFRAWYLSINPLWPQFSNADDGDYFRRALRFAVTGEYIDDSWLIRPPFHVFVFAGLIRIAVELGGSPVDGVRLIQAFQLGLGVLMVPLCAALAGRLFRSDRAGLIFAALWSIWFPFVELPATLFSEPIYLFLFALHLWLLLRYDDNNRRRDLALSGIVLGMAALTRSPALYALAFAIPWLFWRSWKRLEQSPGASAEATTQGARTLQALGAALPPFALLVATSLLIVLPWTARNWIVYQRFIPVDTLGPINLWLDLGEASERDAKISELREIPQADRQAFATRQARQILAEDPLRPVRPMWGTFRHIWKLQFVEDYFVKRSFFTRPLRQAAALGLVGDLLWLGFTFAGIAGILHPATDRPFKIITGLWLVYSIVTVLIFHVEPRYLLPIWFLLGLYASAVTGGIRIFRLGARRDRLRGSLIGGLLAVLVILFVCYRDYPRILSYGLRREAAMWRGEQAYQQGDYRAAEAAFHDALTADPGFVDAEVALALALGAQGQPQEGLEILRPESSRRSTQVAGALQRAAGNLERARRLLQPAEGRSGEDTQAWMFAMLRPERRSALVLGDAALDLGYIQGFGGAEQAGERTMRWLLGDGSVRLPLPEPIAAGDSVVLELAAPLQLSGPIEVTIDGRWRVDLGIAPNWRSYRLALPTELIGAEQLRIDLQAPTRLPMRENPESDDARPLSIMVHRVAVE